MPPSWFRYSDRKYVIKTKSERERDNKSHHGGLCRIKEKAFLCTRGFNRKANAIEFNMDLLNEHDLKLELRVLKGSYDEICNSSLLLWKRSCKWI